VVSSADQYIRTDDNFGAAPDWTVSMLCTVPVGEQTWYFSSTDWEPWFYNYVNTVRYSGVYGGVYYNTPQGTQTRLTFTCTAAAGVKVYDNGVLIYTGDAADAMPLNDQLNIGNSRNLNVGVVGSEFKDVWVWKRALSDAEVASLQLSQPPVTITYFDEPTNGSVYSAISEYFNTRHADTLTIAYWALVGYASRFQVNFNSSTAYYGAFLRINSTGTMQARLRDGDYWSAGSPLTSDTWHHFALIVTPSTGMFRYYVDGALIETQSNEVHGDSAGVQMYRVICTLSTDDQPVAKLTVSNELSSDQDIADLYAAWTPPT